MNDVMLQGIPQKSASMVSQAVRKYGRGLLQYIRKRVKVLEDAEDILQDIWYQFSKLNSPDEIESISGWLYYAAKNRITNHYRKKQPDHLEDYAFTDEEGELQIKDIFLKICSGRNFILHWMNCPKIKSWYLFKMSWRIRHFRQLLMNRVKTLKPSSAGKGMRLNIYVKN